MPHKSGPPPRVLVAVVKGLKRECPSMRKLGAVSSSSSSSSEVLAANRGSGDAIDAAGGGAGAGVDSLGLGNAYAGRTSSGSAGSFVRSFASGSGDTFGDPLLAPACPHSPHVAVAAAVAHEPGHRHHHRHRSGRPAISAKFLGDAESHCQPHSGHVVPPRAEARGAEGVPAPQQVWLVRS
eukprot:TRINITY_DN283_c0_g1_i3.p1 TRINITY_DN283_c0_g1~~TRINITY_DN283_c0_g1_i3.p1  ORF type:complete len:181 (-),score=14.60 TRINITY_DN283_c0_g1_i3:11-553(-)